MLHQGGWSNQSVHFFLKEGFSKGLSYSDTMAGRIYWTGNYYTGFQTSWGQPWNYRKKANRINVFHLLNGILSFSTQDPPSAFQECWKESNCIPRIETNNPLSYGFRMREGKAKISQCQKSMNKRL